MIGWLLAERSILSVDASSSAGDILGAQRFSQEEEGRGNPCEEPFSEPVAAE
jgi:hypothetical protein